MDIKVVGGVYTEYCAWPPSLGLLGSATRAALCLLQLSNETSVQLISSYSEEDHADLAEQFAFTKGRITNDATQKTTEFFYDHPLAKPRIFPSVDHIKNLPIFQVEGLEQDKIVLFGMYERTPVVNAKAVIYDPQNTLHPRLYSEHNVKAEQLMYVLNEKELTFFHEHFSNENTKSVEEMASWLLEHENAQAIVVKCGSKGAYVVSDTGDSSWITAYQTDVVRPIGSGDSFVAAFAHYIYVRAFDVITAADRASKAAAFYVEKKTMTLDEHIEQYHAKPAPKPKLKKKPKNVYLAGPFFDMAQMWLINESKVCLEGVGLEVFSPYHDIGMGPAEMVAHQDVEAIDKCDIVYALFDDHDPGTLFEIGYAIKAKKKVIIYTEKSSEEHLKMFEGTGCLIERDFATSIYRASWI